MSSVSYGLEMTESSADKPITINIPRKRWRMAVITIYCHRAFLSLLTASKAKKSKVSCSPSTNNVIFQQNGGFKIDQKSLADLVKDKNRDRLQEFNGVEGIVFSLETDNKLGIHGDREEIARRLEAFGSNTYKKAPKKSFFYFVWEPLVDPTLLILIGCAALSLGFGIKEHGLKEGWYEGGSICVAVFLIITISAFSNYRQSKEFDKISQAIDNIEIDVVRDGRQQKVSIFEIVVGDVICLKIGDQVPADGLFLEGYSLQVDESSMTGESDHVEIDSKNPFLFSGTKVVDGYARMVITSIGMNTTWGEMMSSIRRENNDEQTPLQRRLSKLTPLLGVIGLVIALLVLLVLLVHYFTGTTKDEHGNREFNGRKTEIDAVVNSILRMVAAAVLILVIAIPEGVPLAVTLSLAFSMKKMMADHALVRKLSACETMGSVTTICTDKTGTLTLNQMKVTKFWLGQESMAEGSYSLMAANVLDLIREGVALNTTGSVYKSTSGFEFEFSGSPTEKAILSWAVQGLKMDMEGVKQSCTIQHVEAFNSEKKRSGILMRRKIDNTMNVHWKGAAEIILAMCSSYYDVSGSIQELNDDEQRMKFEKIIQGMAASGLRCIAFAHKQVHDSENEDENENKRLKEDSLILLGLVGLKDPCRPGVRKAVEDCQYAKVKIKMITGDNIFTAKAIATECGILRPDQELLGEAVIEGAEFRNYTPEERMEKVDNICVMARSSPFDKLLMVQCLKQKGHVVAVTGDGTNDAPAIKEAHIGLSLGIQGTEVAKESSDIVILDDNFATVATVLWWGRCVYNNIQKFIQFQLTINVATLAVNLVAAVTAGQVPLTAVQLLWVNLIMDTMAALALATDKPTKELMDKPPVGLAEPVITNIMWRNILVQAFYQIAVVLALQFKGKSMFGVDEKVNDTMIFNTFVLCQVFNEFNSRKLEKKNVLEGFHRNKLFLGIIAITIVLQVVMVEFLNNFANTERLNWGQWGTCFGIAAISWIICWVVKWIPVPEKPVLKHLYI
ncbi:putative calcium-transporting ATPase 13, plasma membrane-type [Ziziphus jujuba]|uniref:Calcium-transporting ATPase n=1 Tax=Ziziphus jujuba TaxID=326968 RepID=A0A6P4A4A7_ZIZJJ|nr:putative calcium-transporting ATPase 13, plasma membrane-type [Ziziphus jujuba]